MIRKLCQSTVRLSLRQYQAPAVSSCTPAILQKQQQQTRSYLGDAGEMQPRQINDEVAKREQELWNKAQPKYDAIMERHLRLPTLDNNDNDMTDDEKKKIRELDIRKKRLIYRSKQRGWLEVDLLLAKAVGANFFFHKKGYSPRTAESDGIEFCFDSFIELKDYYEKNLV